jgi:hypothetical protein
MTEFMRRIVSFHKPVARKSFRDFTRKSPPYRTLPNNACVALIKDSVPSSKLVIQGRMRARIHLLLKEV